jgi:hypothetical protein
MTEDLDIERLGKPVPVNYLVASYLDLKDVVEAVDAMITSDPNVKYPTPIRKRCQISVTPLQQMSGFIMRFMIPEKLLGRNAK